MLHFSRRAVLRNLLYTSACFAAAPLFSLEAQVTDAERAAMARLALEFMEKFAVPGLSIAIARQGRVVYEQPFGVAAWDSRAPLNAANLFRIASVTKPITSVAIFTLREKGKLALSDRVFGEGSILGTAYGTQPYKRYVTDITVDHLLTHSCGGWMNDSSDPMFRHPQMNHAELISWTLDTLPLLSPPGRDFMYSNFGYCVLGRVIEKISGQPYADFVSREVLSRCAITDMQIAGNTLRQRAPGEVVYEGQAGENPYNMNVARMDSHGGWIGSASDLARFAAHAAGIGPAPALLKPESVSKMVSPGPPFPGLPEVAYARGWWVRGQGKGNWWHDGSLPGTTSIMVKTSSGFSWAALCNTRRPPSVAINNALDNLVWQMARHVSAWPL